MADAKHRFEFGINMFGTLPLLLQQDGLETVVQSQVQIEEPLHIYMVCQRPRITLDPNVFYADENNVRLRFRVQKQNEFELFDIVTANHLSTIPKKLICHYPHTEYAIYGPNDELLSNGKVGLLAHTLHQTHGTEILNLEVLYIGQSYGVKGNRTSTDRLINHATLQAIYADTIRHSPDQEIWLVLWHFEPVMAQMIFPPSVPIASSESESEEHLKNTIDQLTNGGLSEQQQINFTEAALIRYFEPKYNKMFKGSFPNPAHSTYSECYTLDLNAVSVELNTIELGGHLWSAKEPPRHIHFIIYPLHSEAERRSMFDF